MLGALEGRKRSMSSTAQEVVEVVELLPLTVLCPVSCCPPAIKHHMHTPTLPT